MKKPQPKRIDVFTDQKRAEAEAKAKTDSVEFMREIRLRQRSIVKAVEATAFFGLVGK